MDLVAIQAEQIAWSVRNFGRQHERYPLLGMIEEILEFDEAWKLRDKKIDEAYPLTDTAQEELDADVLDAIGDIAIYMLDYCGKRGLQLVDLWEGRASIDMQGKLEPHDLTPLARLLAHHQLKGEQGIRGTPEEHALKIKVTCQAILAQLEAVCRRLNADFLSILEAVWSKVRQRDWVKNRANAHEVVEQQVIDTTNVARNTDP